MPGAAHGMLRLSRAPRGTSAGFYYIFVSPLNRHLYLTILLFLVDEETEFTIDSIRLAISCPFLWRQTLTFRQVDTPSVASVDSDDGFP